ncbi:MAG: hypothetical protein K2J90_06035 [Lachnospiraceae bacterium]|nr:hypothetical protein [Lachnospiraceae bacterium]
MNLKSKKKMIMAGIVLFTGAAAFTSQAASYTNLISGGYGDAGVWGSANINSAAYSYGGGLVGNYKDAASGQFTLQRTDGSKVICNRLLKGLGYNKCIRIPDTTRCATKRDRAGLKLSVKLNGASKKSAIIKSK